MGTGYHNMGAYQNQGMYVYLCMCPYVQHMYNTCTMYALYLCDICTIYVLYMYYICTIYVLYMYYICTMYVYIYARVHMYNVCMYVKSLQDSKSGREHKLWIQNQVVSTNFEFKIRACVKIKVCMSAYILCMYVCLCVTYVQDSK